MNRETAQELVKTIFNVTEIARELRPDIVFEASVVKWSENKYHVELTANTTYYVGKKLLGRDLFTRDHGKIMTMRRVMALYKDLSHCETLEIQKRYIERKLDA